LYVLSRPPCRFGCRPCLCDSSTRGAFDTETPALMVFRMKVYRLLSAIPRAALRLKGGLPRPQCHVCRMDAGPELDDRASTSDGAAWDTDQKVVFTPAVDVSSPRMQVARVSCSTFPRECRKPKVTIEITFCPSRAHESIKAGPRSRQMFAFGRSVRRLALHYERSPIPSTATGSHPTLADACSLLRVP